jgi:ATP-dependent DNA helicase RecG
VSTAARAPAGLDTPLQYLKGVGPQRARLLERLGLQTVRDGLNHFPRDYQDRRQFVPFHKLPLGESAVVQGTVFGVAAPRRGSRAPVHVTFRDQTGYFTALWFGRGFLAQVFKRDQRVVLYGKKTLAKDRRVVLDNPDFEIVEEDELASIHMGRLVPVYALTEGLPQRLLRSILHGTVESHAEQVPDILPDELRRRRDLLPVARAYRAVHFPERMEDVEAARRRFAFEDFFVLQVGLT